MKRHRFAFVAAACAFGVLATIAHDAPAQAQARVQTSLDREAWEYAELRIVGNDAVIITRADAQFMEGLSDREARQFIKLDNDKLRIRQPARIRHLTRAGSQGWQVVESIPGGPNEAYLLQRRYRINDGPASP